MSDACKFCDLRGKDRKLCEYKCWCDLPESWYAGELLRENMELRVLAKSSIDNGDAIMAELVTAMKKCVELDKENAHLWRIVKAAGEQVAEIRDSLEEESHER
jgi:hypothetical protein